MPPFLEGVDIQIIVIYLSALGGFVSVIAVALPFLQTDRRGSRLRTVSERRQELSRQQIEGLSGQRVPLAQQRRQARIEMMKKVIGQLGLADALSSQQARLALSQAGFRGQQALVTYTFLRLVGAVGGVALVLFLLAVWQDFPYPFVAQVLLVGLGGVIGFYLPKVLVSNISQKRQEQMTQAFPDAMDLMVICVEAGLSVEATLDRLADEIHDSSPILAQEFGLTAAELSFLTERRRAYENFRARTGLPAAKALSTTLIQSERYGTSVAQALKILAQEKRDERMSAAEKKAASLPAKLTVPMIVFFLPVLFMVVIGPAIIQIVRM